MPQVSVTNNIRLLGDATFYKMSWLRTRDLTVKRQQLDLDLTLAGSRQEPYGRLAVAGHLDAAGQAGVRRLARVRRNRHHGVQRKPQPGQGRRQHRRGAGSNPAAFLINLAPKELDV